MRAAANEKPGGTAIPAGRRPPIPAKENQMDKPTITTERSDAATVRDTRLAVSNAIDDAKISMHLSMAATLLYRHLVLADAKDGTVCFGEQHAEALHSLIDLAWGRAQDVVDNLVEISEAAR